MADKKIIDKEDVKQNNPNDDEEILKNPTEDDMQDNTIEKSEEKDKDEKAQDSETIGIP